MAARNVFRFTVIEFVERKKNNNERAEQTWMKDIPLSRNKMSIPLTVEKRWINQKCSSWPSPQHLPFIAPCPLPALPAVSGTFGRQGWPVCSASTALCQKQYLFVPLNPTHWFLLMSCLKNDIIFKQISTKKLTIDIFSFSGPVRGRLTRQKGKNTHPLECVCTGKAWAVQPGQVNKRVNWSQHRWRRLLFVMLERLKDETHSDSSFKAGGLRADEYCCSEESTAAGGELHPTATVKSSSWSWRCSCHNPVAKTLVK